MQKKFKINRTKIKGGCKLGRKVVTHNSKSDLPLVLVHSLSHYYFSFRSFRMKKMRAESFRDTNKKILGVTKRELSMYEDRYLVTSQW